MKLIIDIPEGLIESAKSSPNYYPLHHFEKIWRAIANGIPYEETISAYEIAGQRELKRQDDLNNIKFERGKEE